MKIAIYSRKSVFTGKGESIENQIELCKEYYCRNYENDVEFTIYEDEGFSGGNINRPQFKKLLKDIKTKKYDALICYRLDRISRNVADFSATLELLQTNNCDFISIKEQFDTSTPMGRAMVYISSVFAQLERETIAERVRDNMLQLSKTGRWLGGITPLGFDSERVIYYDDMFKEKSMSKLIPNAEELEIVKEIYSLYLNLQSATQVAKTLAKRGINGKRDGFLNSGRILDILQNPVYVISDDKVHEYLKSKKINVFGEPNGCGYLSYNKDKDDKSEWIAAISNHKGIINSGDWIKVQQNRSNNKGSSIKSNSSISETLLNGVLKCGICGSSMYSKKGRVSPKTGNPKYYYICSQKEHKFKTTCNNKNINSCIIDGLVLKELKTYDKEYLKKYLIDTVNSYKKVISKNNNGELIETKEKQISNLIQQLSLAPNQEISSYIMNEISKMQAEVKDLKAKMEVSKNDDDDIMLDITNIELLNDLITNFNNSIDYIEGYEEKRRLLQTIVQEVRWNGDKYSLEIDLVGTKKKLR